MTLEKAKLFWKPGNKSRGIIVIPYDDRMEYYSFVKERHDAGFRQIIVTSETMIQLIQQILTLPPLTEWDSWFNDRCLHHERSYAVSSSVRRWNGQFGRVPPYCC